MEKHLPAEEVLFFPAPKDVVFSPSCVEHPIAFDRLDEDAVKVVYRLGRFGHEAYLVGGCIRDLLLGRPPKDYDVATSARPSQIKRLFRNCRLIGRRFRLAHIVFRNDKVIEVATFRRTATMGDDVSKRHAAENLFGGPADDAIRRDFTINALMYDVRRRQVHDYVGGLDDIKTYTLRTIGDPNRRLPEDPVRIIRAVKFSILLDLTIDPTLADAMKQHAPLIVNCAPARLVEELFKLLRSGASVECLEQLQEIDILKELTPAIAERIADSTDSGLPWRVLGRADAGIRKGRHYSDAVLLAALLYPFCEQALAGPGDVSKNLEAMLVPLVSPLRFTRRHLARVRQIFMAQRRLATGQLKGRIRRILKRDYAADAIDFLDLISEENERRGLKEKWRGELAKVNPVSGAKWQSERAGQKRGSSAQNKGKKRAKNRKGAKRNEKT